MQHGLASMSGKRKCGFGEAVPWCQCGGGSCRSVRLGNSVVEAVWILNDNKAAGRICTVGVEE